VVPHSPTVLRLFVWCTLIAVCAGPVLAQGQAMSDAAPSEAPTGLFGQDSLTNGWFGMAAPLKDKGIVLGAIETAEVLGNVTGGSKTGTIFEGRLELDLDLDLDRILGLPNTVLHANAYQIHGRGLSGNYLAGNAQTVSSIEATRATRLFDLWVERGFYDNALSVRIGQIAADDEFFTSQYAAGLINATFGWPALMSLALPNGGPVYPLATPGIRVKYAFNNALALQAAIFNGDPAGGDPGTSAGGVDPQASNPDGLRFPVDHSALLIAELSYSPGADGSAVPATVYKLGIWRQGGRYDDASVDTAGRPLTDPLSNGRPRPHDGDFGIYAVADMLLFNLEGSADRSLSGFFRTGGDPGDRNFVDYYVDGGLLLKGPFGGRVDDVASLGVSYAASSGPAGTPGYQAALEASYQVTLAPWWSVQPDMQMVFHPGPAGPRPAAATASPRVGNAFVLGLRTSIRF